MKKRISTKELSAYLDGEARDPREIRLQLDEQGDVAERLAELKRVSSSVRELEVLDAREGFVQRVLASIDTGVSIERRSIGWRMPVGISLASVAAAAILMLAIGLRDASAPVVDQVALMPQDESALLAELEQKLVASDTVDPTLVGSFFDEPAPASALPEELILALASTEWLVTFEGPGSDALGYESELAALDASERDVLMRLLSEYSEGELKAQQAQEG